VSREQMSGHVMLTGGRGLWTTATAAVGPQCWAMRGISVIGSRLKSTKELQYMASFQLTHCQDLLLVLCDLLSPLSGRLCDDAHGDPAASNNK